MSGRLNQKGNLHSAVYPFGNRRNIPKVVILNRRVRRCRINIRKELRFLTFRDAVITFSIASPRNAGLYR